MTAERRGYFCAIDPRIRPGQRYGFSLDGGPPRPDPRSQHQPLGVHGPSEWVDLDAFVWTDAGFNAKPLGAAVIYELHVGTFTPDGTFDSIIEHLDGLVELGVTHVELMPVAHFPGVRGWGYDGVALFAPHTAYGGFGGLQRLVDACHARGLAVVLDVVYNHLGPSGNYLGQFGPYFTPKYRTPWGEALNFDDAGSDEVRRFVCDNAAYWFRHFHIDGLRLDAIHAIFDQSATHILEELSSKTELLGQELGRNLVLIAESGLNDARVVNPPEVGGYGLNAQWSDDFHHALHAVLTGESNGYYEDYGTLQHLAAAVQRGFVYNGVYSRFRGHSFGGDTSTLRSRQLVCFSQNHDQVGNRATGDRLASTLSPELLKVAAAMVLLGPFIPLLFMGEEWGCTTPFQYFADHEEEELRLAVRDGRRREFAAFGWAPADVPDPGARSTFDNSRLDWTQRSEGGHAALLGWYRELLRLRRAEATGDPVGSDPSRGEFSRGQLLRNTTVDYDEQQRWLTFTRGSLIVCCHFGPGSHRWPLLSSKVVLASGPVRSVKGAIELGGPSVVVAARGADGPQ